MSMYGDDDANYPQQWRRPQGNYWTAASDSPPVPILAITAIIIFFIYMSTQFGFTKVESHSGHTEVGMYMFLIVLVLVMVYVAGCMLCDSFSLGIRPSNNWYGQRVNGVGAGSSGWSVVIVVAMFGLLLVLAFDNPVLSVPVALAGAFNMLAAFY